MGVACTSQSFIVGSLLVYYFILLIRPQTPKADPWRNGGSIKIILMEIRRLVPKGARRKEGAGNKWMDG